MNPDSCSDCSSISPQAIHRRAFLQKAGLAAGGVTAGGILTGRAAQPMAANPIRPNSETLVKTFYDSLSEEQRGKICFGFDHDLRLKVDNNWHITKTLVQDFTRDQQEMIRKIFIGLHSEEYAQKVYNQVQHDSGKRGFAGGSSVAIFGEPGTGKFQFVLTGRHCTRRCDGDSVAGASFGGPIFYGHAADGFREGPDHKGNAYWYQALRANEVYQMLDGKQREAALMDTSRGEHGNDTVRLTGKKQGLEGIRMAELAGDQKDHVMKVIGDLLAPFREQDAAEAIKHITAGGTDNLHLAFYKDENIGEDEVWDTWQIEGPNCIFYFRGKPHVHAWMHVKDPKAV